MHITILSSELYLFTKLQLMKPLQFHQRKADFDWLYLLVSPNTSQLTYDLKNIRAWSVQQSRYSSDTSYSIKKTKILNFNKLNWKKTKRRIAELLTEYYSILFNPQYLDWFRPMTDLTLLFPTNETIYISNATNFILLPLPLPTYSQHTQWRFNDRKFRVKYPCPFIRHDSTNQINNSNSYSKLSISPDEVVRDMDYRQDNSYVMSQRDINSSNMSKGFVHTNPDVKASRIKDKLDKTARIRVYKFDDIKPEEAKMISTYPAYSMWQRIKQPNIPSPSQIKEWIDNTNPNETAKQRSAKARAKYDMIWYNEYVHRQYTFLEITPNYYREDKEAIEFMNKNSSRTQNLQSYSSKYLEPTQLTKEFAECFDFESPSKESIIQYFMHNAYCNEYSARQIQWGIDRLKNIIKYKKPKKPKKKYYETLETYEQPKFNQHVRSLNIKQSDWSFQSQMIEDFNITNRKSLEDTKPLSTNNNTND